MHVLFGSSQGPSPFSIAQLGIHEDACGMESTGNGHLWNKEKEKWINDYVDTETAVPRMRVDDATTTVKQMQEDISNAEKAGLTTTSQKQHMRRC
jgi:hypothetical protein